MHAPILIILLAIFSFSSPVHAAAKLTLPECVDIALKHQPSIQAAQQNVIAGRSRETQARSRYYPQFTASSGYSEDRSLGGAFGESSTKSYVTSLQLDQMLYDFGRTGNSVDAARWNTRSLKRELDAAVQDVVLEVKQAYYSLLAAENLVAVAEKSLAQTESRLQQAQAFFRAGSKPRFEVTRAEVDVNTAKLNLITARNNVRISSIALNNAMGVPPGQETVISEELPPIPPLPTLEQAEALALLNRPQMLRAAAEMEAAEARVRAERSNYFPTIAANGVYNWANGTSEFGGIAGMPIAGDSEVDINNSWNAGVILSVPLFEGWLTRGRVREARANHAAIAAQRDAIRQSVLLEVNQSYADMESARVRIEVMKSSLQKARESLELAQGRYEAGVGPFIEVTDAQLAAVQAETDFIQAQYDYRLSVARLFRAIGKNEEQAGE